MLFIRSTADLEDSQTNEIYLTMLSQQKHSGSRRRIDEQRLVGYNVILSEAPKIYKMYRRPKANGL